MILYAITITMEHRTVRLCDELLVGLGMDPLAVTYKENPWAAGAAAGPSWPRAAGRIQRGWRKPWPRGGRRSGRGPEYSPFLNFL